MPRHTCPVCQTEFTAAPSAKARFCSRKCAASTKRKGAPAIPKAPVYVSIAGGVPTKRIGRPPSRHWPVRTCKHCNQSYQGRNVSYCSETCRQAHTKEALPEIAERVRPLLGKKSYREIADIIAKDTGKPCRVSQIGRAVAKIRAVENAEHAEAARRSEEALQAARLAVEMGSERARANALRRRALDGAPAVSPPPPPLPRMRHQTQSGAVVTLRATARPVVTEDEVRLGRAVLAGADRGLKMAPEKPRRKRKAPRLTLVPSTAGREV